MLIESNLKPKDYYAKDVVRIKNLKQVLLYVKNQIFPIDIYCSFKDNTTDEVVLIFIFLKDETREVYKKWCDYELR